MGGCYYPVQGGVVGWGWRVTQGQIEEAQCASALRERWRTESTECWRVMVDRGGGRTGDEWLSKQPEGEQTVRDYGRKRSQM